MGLRRTWLLVCLTAAGALAGQVTRDWSHFPAIIETDSSENVYVIGDVHADYDRLIRLLDGAGIIDGKPQDPAKVKWKAGRSLLIFMGDLIDKGDRALEVIALVQYLQVAAQEQGGAVVALMGNHEAEFLANPLEKKVREFAAELTARRLLPQQVADCQGPVGRVLCSEPVAVRVRDWFFCHGGNTQGRTIPALTQTIQAGVDSKGFGSPELVGDNSILEARLGEKGPEGKPWIESGPGGAPAPLLQAYVRALGVRHIVQGHQPGAVSFPEGVQRKKGQMFQYSGLLFLVDTGMSRGVDDSEGAALLIQSGDPERAIAICPDGTRTTLWDSKMNSAGAGAKACGK